MSSAALDPRTLLPTALFVEPSPLLPHHPQSLPLPLPELLPKQQSKLQPQPAEMEPAVVSVAAAVSADADSDKRKRESPQPQPHDNEDEDEDALSPEDINRRMYHRSEGPPSPHPSNKRIRQGYDEATVESTTMAMTPTTTRTDGTASRFFN